MTDRAEEQFARAIVRDAGERYVADERVSARSSTIISASSAALLYIAVRSVGISCARRQICFLRGRLSP
jgi:hypothetical protein